MLSPDELAAHFRGKTRYAADASGHEHVEAGSPEGGQFTGKAEHGQSPDDMANKLQEHSAAQESDGNTESDDTGGEERIATGKENAIKDILNHQADYGEDDPEMNADLINELLSNADVDKGDREKVIGELYDHGFLAEGADEGSFVPGPEMKALASLKEFAADNPDDVLDVQMIANLTGQSLQDAQNTVNVLSDYGYLNSGGTDDAFTVVKDRFRKLGRKHRYARMKSPDQLAAHFRYGKDATGHEHVGKGSPEGGQFTGKAEHGQSPDDMARKLAQQPKVKGPSVDDMADFLVDNGTIGSEQADDFSPEQITAMYTKAKGGSAPAAATTSGGGSSEDIAKKIEGMTGTEAGYAHGGATMTAAYPVAKMLAGTKFSGNITPDAVTSVLADHGIIGEHVGNDKRLRVTVQNPKALRAILEAATTGSHEGSPVANSMNLRRVAQAVAPFRG